MAFIGADLSKVQTQTYDPIPPGEYIVKVTDSAVAMTKTTGKPMLKITYTVSSGPFTGRKVFDNFLIGNEIAMSRMKTLATVGGHRHPDMINDSDELHGLELIITVKLKNDPNYPPANSVTSFKKLENKTSPMLPPTSQTPPTQTTPSLPTTPPFQFAQAPSSVSSAPSSTQMNPTPSPVVPATSHSETKLPWEN